MFKSKRNFRRVASEFPLVVGAIMFDLHPPRTYAQLLPPRPPEGRSSQGTDLNFLGWHEDRCSFLVANATPVTVYEILTARPGTVIYVEVELAVPEKITWIKKVTAGESRLATLWAILGETTLPRVSEIKALAVILEQAEPGTIKAMIIRPKQTSIVALLQQSDRR